MELGIQSAAAALPMGPSLLLPFFVYGTLQAGFKNHINVVNGRIDSIFPATLLGTDVYHFVDFGFPGAYNSDSPASSVIGQLLYIPVDVYLDVLRDLDLLEAYHGPGDADNMYERVEREVIVTIPASTDASTVSSTSTSSTSTSSTITRVRAWFYKCLLPLRRVDLASKGSSKLRGSVVAQAASAEEAMATRTAVPAVLVPGGDWRAWMAANRLEDAGDDWANGELQPKLQLQPETPGAMEEVVESPLAQLQSVMA